MPRTKIGLFALKQKEGEDPCWFYRYPEDGYRIWVPLCRIEWRGSRMILSSVVTHRNNPAWRMRGYPKTDDEIIQDLVANPEEYGVFPRGKCTYDDLPDDVRESLWEHDASMRDAVIKAFVEAWQA